jgi:hypothetical protein
MNKATCAAHLYALHLVFSAADNPRVIREDIVLVYAATSLIAESRASALGRSLEKLPRNVPALQGSAWSYAGLRKVARCELTSAESLEAIVATSFSLEVDEPDGIRAILEGGFAKGVLDW